VRPHVVPTVNDEPSETFTFRLSKRGGEESPRSGKLPCREESSVLESLRLRLFLFSVAIRSRNGRSRRSVRSRCCCQILDSTAEACDAFRVKPIHCFPYIKYETLRPTHHLFKVDLFD